MLFSTLLINDNTYDTINVENFQVLTGQNLIIYIGIEKGKKWGEREGWGKFSTERGAKFPGEGQKRLDRRLETKV